MGPRNREARHAFAVALATEATLPIETPRLVELYREAGLTPGASEKVARTAARRTEKALAPVVAHHRDEPVPAAAVPKKRAEIIGPGRPPDLTPEVHRQIVGLIRLGHSQEAAAAAAEVGPRTFYEWMAKGRNGEIRPEYAQFAQAVTNARPRGKLRFEHALIKEALGKGPPKVRTKRELVPVKVIGEDGEESIEQRMTVTEETTETRAPMAATILEILARRHPKTWRKTDRLQLQPVTPETAEPELRKLLGLDEDEQLAIGAGDA